MGIKVKASRVINSELPMELYFEITKDGIREILEEEFQERALSKDEIEEIRKLKPKIKEMAASAMLEYYKDPGVLLSILDKSFILMDEPAQALAAALKMEQNIIFCGKGGYGKSEMVKALFSNELLKDKVFIKSLNESTTEEDLFGGVRMKELMETGAILYKTENSFINYEIAVFEEMFDADISVLSALKDALSSKEIRNGVQREPVKTKIIIGLTNKSPKEVISNNSTEALIQRFPFIQEMQYQMTNDVLALMILKSMDDLDKPSLEDILKMEVLTGMASKDLLTPRKVMQIIKFIDSKIEITGGQTSIAEINANRICEQKKIVKDNLEFKAKEFITKARAAYESSKKIKMPTLRQLSEYDKNISGWKI